MMFSVSPATFNDLATLTSFIIAEANEAEGSHKSLEIVEKGVRAGLENPAIARYWVLETNQVQTVGSLSVVKEWSDWHAGYYWWIQSMFIHPDYRSQGLMNLLLNAVREAARDEDALAIRLYVHKNNTRAIKAYRREGFADTPYQIMAMEP